MKYPHLFEPIQIGETVVKNRVFMPPISTNLANKGYITDELVSHYAAETKGWCRINYHRSTQQLSNLYLFARRYFYR